MDWIEPADLQRVTDDFIRFVEDDAKMHHVPVLQGKPGERHVDQAVSYLERVADKDEAVYCIIKVQEETSSFVSHIPKTGPISEEVSQHVLQSLVQPVVFPAQVVKFNGSSGLFTDLPEERLDRDAIARSEEVVAVCLRCE